MIETLTPLALVTQVAPESVSVPMSPLGDQLALSFMIVQAIEYAKRSAWFPWLSARTETLNKVVAVFLSGLAAVGITATYDADAQTLTIAGLSAMNVAILGWAWIKSYMIQQLTFRATIYKQPSVEQAREIAREAKTLATSDEPSRRKR